MDDIDLTFYKGSGFNTTFTITDSSGTIINLSEYVITLTLFNEHGAYVTSYVTPTATQLVVDGLHGELTLIFTEAEVDSMVDGTYTVVIKNGGVPITAICGNIFVVKTYTSNVEYLIPFLRLRLGDINPDSYRYLDEWLLKALVMAVKVLQRYWNFKYIISESNVVTRNPYATSSFVNPEPPIIDTSDEYVLILMAAIITLEGSLENSAWNVASWSDAEIRYTNIDSGRIRESNLKRLWDELDSIILPPVKRLARTKKESLPGYLGNEWEHKTLL